jgi:hypothetical protein
MRQTNRGSLPELGVVSRMRSQAMHVRQSIEPYPPPSDDTAGYLLSKSGVG